MTHRHFVGIGNSHKLVTRPFVGIGGAWQGAKRGFIGVGGVWELFYVNFEISVSPTSIVRASGGQTVTTTAATVTVQGPENPTAAWVQTGGIGNPLNSITINSPNSLSTAFTGSSIPTAPGEPPIPNVGTFRCIVTDPTTGDVLTSDEVTVSFTA